MELEPFWMACFTSTMELSEDRESAQLTWLTWLTWCARVGAPTVRGGPVTVSWDPRIYRLRKLSQAQRLKPNTSAVGYLGFQSSFKSREIPFGRESNILSACKQSFEAARHRSKLQSDYIIILRSNMFQDRWTEVWSLDRVDRDKGFDQTIAALGQPWWNTCANCDKHGWTVDCAYYTPYVEILLIELRQGPWLAILRMRGKGLRCWYTSKGLHARLELCLPPSQECKIVQILASIIGYAILLQYH